MQTNICQIINNSNTTIVNSSLGLQPLLQLLAFHQIFQKKRNQSGLLLRRSLRIPSGNHCRASSNSNNSNSQQLKSRLEVAAKDHLDLIGEKPLQRVLLMRRMMKGSSIQLISNSSVHMQTNSEKNKGQVSSSSYILFGTHKQASNNNSLSNSNTIIKAKQQKIIQKVKIKKQKKKINNTCNNINNNICIQKTITLRTSHIDLTFLTIHMTAMTIRNRV